MRIPSAETLAKVEVLADLEPLIDSLMVQHEAKRVLWFPSELLALFRKTGKPIAVSVDSGRVYDDFVQVLQRGGIPVWRKIDRASRALSALATL